MTMHEVFNSTKSYKYIAVQKMKSKSSKHKYANVKTADICQSEYSSSDYRPSQPSNIVVFTIQVTGTNFNTIIALVMPCAMVGKEVHLKLKFSFNYMLQADLLKTLNCH